MKKSVPFSPLMIILVLFGLIGCKPGQDIPTAQVDLSPTNPGTNPTPSAPAVEETEVVQVEPADLIFHNGNLVTMETGQPTAQALAVLDGRIQAIGSDQEVLALQGPDTVVVDLQGRTLMPGFIDGHTHILTFYGRKGRTLDEAQEEAISHGFTGVTEMWANTDTLGALRQAAQAGILRLRVSVFPSYNDGILDGARHPILMKTWYPANAPLLDPESMLRIPGIKVFVDGDNTTYERGCWALSDPFLPTAGALQRGVCGTERGDLYWEQGELNQVVRKAQQAGYRVAFHAMGDAAIEAALNAIEYALDGRSNLDVRHQIEHNSMIRPDLLPRYESLQVAASVRGYADLCDLSGLDVPFGSYRRGWYINRYELPTLGTHAYVETDFGWTVDPDDRYEQRTTDPIVQLYGLVTHRYIAPGGSICGPDSMVTDKGITVQRALEMLTMEPAWAVSMEEYVGSLKAGKFADLIILSGDPLTVAPETLKDLTVLMTMVAGKVEYCAPGQTAFCPSDRNLPVSGNLALQQHVSASNSIGNDKPARAVDGLDDTKWCAGDFAPQWIQIDLGAPALVTEVRLRVSQSPVGNTVHAILLKRQGGDFSEVFRFDQVTADLEWLTFQPESPLEGVIAVRIETISSPSWIAWFEVQVMGTR